MQFVKSLSALSQADLPLAGGKGANLGALLSAGLPVPPGVCVTTAGYRAFVAANGLQAEILRLCAAAQADSPASLENASAQIRALFAAGSIPPALASEISQAYSALNPKSAIQNPKSAVAVRSSATAEDLPDMSFAGQQDTYLNIVGAEAVLDAVQRCWGSLWTARAIGYRARNGIAHSEVALAVVVQAMIESEASGVLFTANPLTGKRAETVIDATLGLGEALVSGQVEPDHYVVDAASGKIISKTLGAKALAIRGQSGGGTVTVNAAAGDRQALPDAQILELARLGQRAVEFFKTPQDMEWAWVGESIPSVMLSEAKHPQVSGETLRYAQGDKSLPPNGNAPPVMLSEAKHPQVSGETLRYAQGDKSLPPNGNAPRAGGQLYVVQSRPITSLYPLPAKFQSEAPLQVLFSFGVWQGMLDPYTPLGQDVLAGLVVGMAKRFGGTLTLETQDVFVEAGERLFVNITPLLQHSLGRRVVGVFVGSIDPPSSAVLEALLQDPRLAPAAGGMKLSTRLRLARWLAPLVFNVLFNLVNPVRGRARLQRQIEAGLQTLLARKAAAPSLAERVALFETTLINQPYAWLPFLLPAVISGQAAFQTLLRVATSSLPDGEALALELTRSLPHNVTTEMDLALWATARAIKADAAAVQHFTETDAAALAAEYQAGKLPPAAQAALKTFMQQYGVRGVGEIDMGRRRWNEDPTHLLQVLQSYLQIEVSDASPEAVFRRGAVNAEAAGKKLIAALRRTPGGWLKARLARWQVRRVRELVGLRETPKFTIIRLTGILRAALLDGGQKLAAEGVLAQADDVFFLRLAELKALAANEKRDWPALIAARRQTYARELRRRQLPRVLLSDGTAYYEGVQATGETDKNALVGSPVSAGVVEGVAHVILNPHGEQLAPGEILVCPATDPAWTPLFLAAGGLVLEVGGMMTHGSVVAREYGIPAVVGVTEATTRIKTGQRIRVDGSSGRVVVLESREA